jgi:hypothetical protein
LGNKFEERNRGKSVDARARYALTLTASSRRVVFYWRIRAKVARSFGEARRWSKLESPLTLHLGTYVVFKPPPTSITCVNLGNKIETGRRILRVNGHGDKH